MRLRADLDLPGLEEALAGLLPLGVVPLGLELGPGVLRLRARAPMVGEVVLVARLLQEPGRLTLADLDLEGAGLARGLVLGRLRQAIAGLDRRHGQLHLWGESDGERLHLAWPVPGAQ